jgi:hypothetical protein
MTRADSNERFFSEGKGLPCPRIVVQVHRVFHNSPFGSPEHTESLSLPSIFVCARSSLDQSPPQLLYARGAFIPRLETRVYAARRDGHRH